MGNKAHVDLFVWHVEDNHYADVTGCWELNATHLRKKVFRLRTEMKAQRKEEHN